MAGQPIQSRQTVSLVTTIVLLSLSTVFVVLRLVARIGIVRKLYLDDYFIVAAWLVAFGLSFAVCYGTSVGLGRHQEDIPSSWESALKKSEYAFSVLYNPALMLTKTSILIFYLRLSRVEKVFRWACFGTLAVVNLGGLALTILNIAQCTPISAAFATPVPGGSHCIDIVTLYLSSAPLNIITDLAILFLPFPILTTIKLPKKQKIILLVTFGFGAFVAVVDVVRIAYLQNAFERRLQDVQSGSSSGDSRNSSDFSWYGAISYTWSVVEVHVGIMVACVPALKPLVARFVPNMLRDSDEQISRATEGGESPTKSIDAMRKAQRIPSAPSSPMYFTASRSGNEHIEEVEEQQMSFEDFLTTPEMDDLTAHQPEGLQRTQTAMTNTSRHTRRQEPAFFDFVNMHKSKSLVHMTNRESLLPIALVTVLFFVWGFAYGLLDSLNAQFQRVAHMSTGQTIGIHSAYYGGYFVASLTFGRLTLKYWGFKACFIIGLAIYACGTLVFWPAAVLTSFPAFLVSNFIVGLGLSTLEIAANPFIALCGPQRWMEVRLNFSQGIQATASILAPLLASKVLFKDTASSDTLTNVQWTYLGIALFTVLLAVAYYYVPLPEATAAELEEADQRHDRAQYAKVRIPFSGGINIRIVVVTLLVAVFAQWCYVGAQESVSTNFSPYLSLVNSRLDQVNFLAIAHTAFAASRFFAALVGIWVKPRYLLAFFFLGAIAFSAVCMSDVSAATGTAAIIMVYFFEGPLFGLIYAIALRVKDASALLTAAISGGAVWPAIIYAVWRTHGEQYSFCVIVAAFAAGSVMALWTNGSAYARTIADPDQRQSDMSTRKNTAGSLPTVNVPATTEPKVHAPSDILRERQRRYNEKMAAVAEEQADGSEGQHSCSSITERREVASNGSEVSGGIYDASEIQLADVGGLCR